MRRSNSCLPPGRSFHGCSTIKNLAKEVARDAVAAARHSFLRRNGLPECALQDSLLVVRIARSIFLSSSFSGAVHFVRLRTKKWSLAQCCCCRCRLLVGTVGLPVLGVRTRRTCRDATGGQRNRAVNFSAIGSCARVSILPPPPPYPHSSFLYSSFHSLGLFRYDSDFPSGSHSISASRKSLLSSSARIERIACFMLRLLFLFDIDADLPTATGKRLSVNVPPSAYV